MCRKVGGSYTPPPKLPFDLAAVEAVAAPQLRTILMPGAIVIGDGKGNTDE
jgi:hypothetical protein